MTPGTSPVKRDRRFRSVFVTPEVSPLLAGKAKVTLQGYQTHRANRTNRWSSGKSS